MSVGSFADDVCVISQSPSSKRVFAPNFTYKLQLDDNLVLRAARWSAHQDLNLQLLHLGQWLK